MPLLQFKANDGREKEQIIEKLDEIVGQGIKVRE